MAGFWQKIFGRFDSVPYTPGLREVIKLSKAEAGRLGHAYVAPEHLLLGIIRKSDGVAVAAIYELGLDLDTLRMEVEQAACLHDHVPAFLHDHVPAFLMTPEAKLVLDLAEAESRRMGHNWLGTDHLLLALSLSSGTIPSQVLERRGLTYEMVQAAVLITYEDRDVVDPTAAPPVPTGFVGPIVVELWRSAAEKARVGGADSRTDSGHVLNAMLDHPESVAGRVLLRLGADPEAIRAMIREEQAKGEMDTN